ncbi:hypothetical protein BGZ74_004054, partial [Mortierella antarctica]
FASPASSIWDSDYINSDVGENISDGATSDEDGGVSGGRTSFQVSYQLWDSDEDEDSDSDDYPDEASVSDSSKPMEATGDMDGDNHVPEVMKFFVDCFLQQLVATPSAADSFACHGDHQGYLHEEKLAVVLRATFAACKEFKKSETCSGECTHGILLTPWRLWAMLSNGRLTKDGSMPAMPERYSDPVAELHLRQWFGERRICMIDVVGLEENRWAPSLTGAGCRVCPLRQKVLDYAPNAWGASDSELESANHASVHESFMEVLSDGADLSIDIMCNACWLFACKRSMMRPGMMPTDGTVKEALASMVPPAVKEVRPQAIAFAEAAAHLEAHCDDVRFFDQKQQRLVTLSTLMRESGQSAYNWFHDNKYNSVFVSHTWGRFWCRKRDRCFTVDVPHVCEKVLGRHVVVTNAKTMLCSIASIGKRYVWLDWLCVDQDDASPQKALMVRLQAALFTVVQMMVVYAHDSQTLTSFQLLRAGITTDADLKRVADGAWFTSLWTLQELALHKKFMGVLSEKGSVIPGFDLRAAAEELVHKGSLRIKHAHWVCNENLLRTGLPVCIAGTSSIYARAASYRVYNRDDRREAYSTGLVRLPGYDHDDFGEDSAGILAS